VLVWTMCWNPFQHPLRSLCKEFFSESPGIIGHCLVNTTSLRLISTRQVMKQHLWLTKDFEEVTSQ
jgi:hypothetical protein